MTDTVVHHQPVWRERATFIIAARLDESGSEQRWRWEQLWARQIGDNRFEVCCIPFFVYDLALADEVETTDLDGKEYVVSSVLNQSGRFTFRAWFSPNVPRDVIIEEITSLGYLIEERWPGSRLIAIDAADYEKAQALADLLHLKELSGVLKYETGRITP